MIIDITKFVDFKAWGNFLNHAFLKSEEWTKHVTHDHHENEVDGYVINVPANFGKLYDKPLTIHAKPPASLRRAIEVWIVDYEAVEHRKHTKEENEAYRMFCDLLKVE